MAAQVGLEKQVPSEQKVATGRQAWLWRPLLTSVHRWLGVIASLYFCAMSVTGVSLVFKEELEEALVKLPSVSSCEHPASLSRVVANLNARFPGQDVTGFVYPLAPAKPLLTWIQDRDGKFTPILVDPGTADVLGVAPENPVLKFLQETHFNLLLNTTGRKINACAGLVLAFLALSGLVLFCRGIAYCLHTLRMQWKGSARVISWSNHQKLGLVMFPMLMVWGVSAFSFGFHLEFQALVNVVLPVTALRQPTATKSAAIDATEPNSLASRAKDSSDRLRIIDAAAVLALSQCPGQDLSRVALPTGKERLIKFWLTNSGSKSKVDATEVDVNIRSGRITAIVTPESRTTGDVLLVWLPRIHFGSFAGIPSKIVWCVIGFTPAILSITGLIMWWHPKRKK